MAGSVVQTRTSNQGVAGSNILAFSGDNTAGNRIIAFVGFNKNGTVTLPPTLGDTRGNTYNLLGTVGTFPSSQVNLGVYEAKNIAAGANTVTATPGEALANDPYMVLVEVAGIQNSVNSQFSINFQPSATTGTDAVTSGTVSLASTSFALGLTFNISQFADAAVGTGFTSVLTAWQLNGSFAAQARLERQTGLTAGTRACTFTGPNTGLYTTAGVFFSEATAATITGTGAIALEAMDVSGSASLVRYVPPMQGDGIQGPGVQGTGIQGVGVQGPPN